MKRLYLFVIIYLMIFSSVKIYAVNCPLDSLNYYATQISKGDTSKINYVLFFKYFPNKFSEFDRLYGFYGKYEDRYTEHLQYFHKSKSYMPDNQFYKKLLNVCVNGKWNADAIGFLQMIITDEIENNLNNIIPILLAFKKEEQYSVFFFMFDALHPEIRWKNFPQYLKRIELDYPELFSISQKAYKDACSNVHNSGIQ